MKTYTVEDLSEILRLDPVTVRTLLRTGKIPGGFKIGLTWRITEDDLNSYIERQKEAQQH